jgi:Tfp pilus assembly protein PilF
MTSRNRSTLVRRLLLGALAALFAATGCATNQPDPELEHRLKQANSHFEIGVDHLENGRFALGVREFLIAESLDPRNARIQVGLAEAYMHKGKVDEAEAQPTCTRARSMRPRRTCCGPSISIPSSTTPG